MIVVTSRSVALAAGFAVLVSATLWSLDRYARHEFTVHLRDQAAEQLALAATGGTPYRWRFRATDDIVAGHPFGATGFEFVDNGLRLHDASEPVEVGLPRSHSIDLKHFPLFHMAADAPAGGHLRLLVREALAGPTLSSADIPIAAGGTQELSAQLDALEWTSAGARAAAPARIVMLRLRFDPAPPGPVLLREISLNRPAKFARIDLNQPVHVIGIGQDANVGDLVALRMPDSMAAQRAVAASVTATSPSSAPPLFVLPQRTRVEQQMSILGALHAALPDAIVLPEAALDDTLSQARDLAANGLPKAKASTQWQWVVLLAVVLVMARLWPPRRPRLRALIAIALTLAVPAWMVLGGHTSTSPTAPQTTMVALSVVYAISLSIPRTWSWLGSPGAWWLAAAVVGVALLLGLALHRAGAEPAGVSGMRHVGRYMLWALLQQYLVCAVCTERWRVVTGSTLAAVYLGALGFALLHSPNAALMLATFIGGLCWCAIWLRYRALLPLALSHAASALLISSLLPAEILHSAEVSARFFH